MMAVVVEDVSVVIVVVIIIVVVDVIPGVGVACHKKMKRTGR